MTDVWRGYLKFWFCIDVAEVIRARLKNGHAGPDNWVNFDRLTVNEPSQQNQ